MKANVGEVESKPSMCPGSGITFMTGGLQPSDPPRILGKQLRTLVPWYDLELRQQCADHHTAVCQACAKVPWRCVYFTGGNTSLILCKNHTVFVSKTFSATRNGVER